MRRAALTVFCMVLLSQGCSRPAGISPLYYIILPELRKGGIRPSAPSNLTAEFQPLTRTILLQWGISMDPDLQIPVQYYRLYLYINGQPPAGSCCQLRDRLDTSVVPYYIITQAAAESIGLSVPFTGTLFFQATGYDGSAESLPSNTASINLVLP